MSKPIKTTLNPSDQALLHKVGSVYGTVKALMGLHVEVTDIIIGSTGSSIWIKEPTGAQRALFGEIIVTKIHHPPFITPLETTTFRDVRISWETTLETPNAN